MPFFFGVQQLGKNMNVEMMGMNQKLIFVFLFSEKKSNSMNNESN